MTRSHRTFAVAVIVVLFAAATWSAEHPQTVPSELPEPLLGVWRQVDDGRYMDLSKDKADFYNYSATFCYRVAPDSGRTLSASYKVYSIDEAGQNLRLWKHDFGDKFERFYRDEFVRINKLPDHTIFDADSDVRFKNPRFVAQFVCEQFDAHFPFFGQRKFDWSARRKRLLNKVNETTSDQDLYAGLCAALTGLGDSHTRIYWTKAEQPFKAGRTRVLSYLESAFSEQTDHASLSAFGGFWQRNMRDQIERLLVDGKMKFVANQHLRWGILKGNIGYIESEFLNGFAPSGTPRPAEVEYLERELDKLLQQLITCDALILDLSYNAGGFDQAALTIASRFADTRRHVMSYRAPGISEALARKCYVGPSGAIQFTKPVFVITSNSTVSAGETLTLALKAFPHVHHVGEATRGCISAFLNKWMPNDFHLTLSNQIWTYPDGTIPEGVGIQPDTPIPVFTNDDFFGSYPNAVQKTIDLILNMDELPQ